MERKRIGEKLRIKSVKKLRRRKNELKRRMGGLIW
jgi:hypothetical protein